MKQKEFITFRFVPTMRCNFRCPYCFLEHSKGSEPTMFDKYSVQDWIGGIKKYDAFDADFYMWGGEPFCIDNTYEFVSELDKLDFVKSIRIDTNMFFYKKIIQLCPSKKLRLNASWHTARFDYQEITEAALSLHKSDLLCMLNFVASDDNLAYLKKRNLNLDAIITGFAEQGVFMNIAADFNKGGADDDYKQFITRYTTIEDWRHIHNEYQPHGVKCDASKSFIFINPDGTLTSCGCKKKNLLGKTKEIIIGNLFEGTLLREERRCPQKSCPSIVSYCHRADNDFSAMDHLSDYVRRNIIHRKKNGFFDVSVFPGIE